MWKLIKWMFFLAVLAGIVLAVTGYKVRGKTIQEHLQPFLESKPIKEGIRDIRSLVGEGLKAAGEAISEDVTESERKQLDELVRKELEKGKPIVGVPGQETLPPTPQPKLPVAMPVSKPSAAKQPEAAPTAPTPAPAQPKPQGRQ